MRGLSVTSYALKEKLYYIVYTWNILERIEKKWCNIGSVQATGSAGGLTLLTAQGRLC